MAHLLHSHRCPHARALRGWRNFLAEERSPGERFSGLWRHFTGKESSLSRLAQLGKCTGAPLEEKSSKPLRGDELLPINQQAVLSYLHPRGEQVAQGVAGMVRALNYLAKFQGQGGWSDTDFRKELSQIQKLTMDHLRRALDYVDECGCYEETVQHLGTVKFDYQGVPVVAREEINAEKVIAAWSNLGQAAVQDAVTFLPEKLREKLMEPAACLKPVHEWPAVPHISGVSHR